MLFTICRWIWFATRPTGIVEVGIDPTKWPTVTRSASTGRHETRRLACKIWFRLAFVWFSRLDNSHNLSRQSRMLCSTTTSFWIPTRYDGNKYTVSRIVFLKLTNWLGFWKNQRRKIHQEQCVLSLRTSTSYASVLTAKMSGIP